MKKLSILYLLLLSSCAQFVPPTGGPKDETAPTLIKSYPENKTLSFKDNTVRLEFDELIDATTIRQELIITPEPKGSFDIKAKPYSVEIKFDQALQDSTTYTLNFRNGIKDLSERNPSKNLKIVFSTGNTIDSLGLNGRVRTLWTNQNANETTVALYDIQKTDTVPLLKRKPDYFIKTDTSGLYSFENIKASKYRLIAFQDKNLNLLYNSKTEQFGFINDTITLDTAIINGIDFKIYPSDTDPPKIQKSLSRQTNYQISFDKGLKNVNVQFIDSTATLPYIFRDKELTFFNYPITSDTIQTKIIVQDSTGNTKDFESKIYFINIDGRKSTVNNLPIRFVDLKNNTKISKPDYYQLEFAFPITQFDESKISILGDSIPQSTITTQWIDSSRSKLKIYVANKAQKELQLHIPSATFTAFNGDTNQTYTLINTLYQQDEYGAINGTYPAYNGQKILQIIGLRDRDIIDSQIFTDRFTFDKLIPSEYILRVIEDTNANGQWDPGNYETNTLPEPIFIYNTLLKLKANFELNDIVIK